MELKYEVSDKAKVLAVVKRAFWLAWQAAGGPRGMGVFRDQPNATEDDVWRNIDTSGDYPGRMKSAGTPPTHRHADYVFGRMMKLAIDHNDIAIIMHDRQPTSDYQAWCHTYPTYLSLLEAAADSLGVIVYSDDAAAK